MATWQQTMPHRPAESSLHHYVLKYTVRVLELRWIFARVVLDIHARSLGGTCHENGTIAVSQHALRASRGLVKDLKLGNKLRV
jgi:hypothetical protein